MIEKIKASKSEKIIFIFVVILGLFSITSFVLLKDKCWVIKDKLVQAGDVEFGKKGNIDYGKIGTGKSGLGTIKSEVDKDFNYTKGSVGLARSLKYDTEDSQFFIILQDEPLYEGEYTPIGKVIFGLEALEKIKYLNKSEYVLRPDFINTLRLFN